MASFLYPASSNPPLRHQLPSSLHIKIFNAIKEIIEIHPCNYFVIERTNAVPQFIESMESYEPEIQEGIMKLLIFIMVDLNFVPLKELAVLSLHLQSKYYKKHRNIYLLNKQKNSIIGSSSGKMIPLICSNLTELLKMSSKFFVVVQEAGLLNIMSLMLSDITEKLQENTVLQKQNDEFLDNALKYFDQVIDCIIAMTSTPANVTIFRKS